MGTTQIWPWPAFLNFLVLQNKTVSAAINNGHDVYLRWTILIGNAFFLSRSSSAMILSIINSVSERANNCYNFSIHWYSLSLRTISQTLSSFLIQSLEWYVLFHGSVGQMMIIGQNVCCILFQSSLKQVEFLHNPLGRWIWLYVAFWYNLSFFLFNGKISWYMPGPQMCSCRSEGHIQPFPRCEIRGVAQEVFVTFNDLKSDLYAYLTLSSRAWFAFLNIKISHTSLPQNHSSTLRVSGLFCPWNLSKWKVFKNHYERETQCSIRLE